MHISLKGTYIPFKTKQRLNYDSEAAICYCQEQPTNIQFVTKYSSEYTDADYIAASPLKSTKNIRTRRMNTASYLSY